MFVHTRLRSQEALDQLCADFAELNARWCFLPADSTFITPDNHYFHHQHPPADADDMAAKRALTTPDLQSYHSTASAPSLRSRDPADIIMQRPFTPPDADAGNVKVVVRVRKFIKRGKAISAEFHSSTPLEHD